MNKNVVELLITISELQTKIGYAKSCHENDRDRMSWENGQKALESAFNLCVMALSNYDPKYFDPALMKGRK